MFAKVGSRLFLIQNKPSKDCQRVLNFDQSGKILSNLVTLLAMPFASDTAFWSNTSGLQYLPTRFSRVLTYLPSERQIAKT